MPNNTTTPSGLWMRLSVLCLLFGIYLVGCPTKTDPPKESARDAAITRDQTPSDSTAPDPTTTATGASLYAKYCALCHGDKGEGYKADNANALNNQHFLITATDAFLTAGIDKGRPGTSMSAWGTASGGPLAPKDTALIVKLIRSWQQDKSINVHDKVLKGQKDRGALYYEFHCQTCHGKEGKGGTYMTISNPEFLANASDGFIRHAIAQGRPGTPMPAFGTQLTPQNIDDLVVLIRSWAKPPDEQPKELPSKELGNPLTNPNGPDPDFKLEGEFVSIDELKAAYDAGKAMVILDARPPADYVRSHISGAVSVPFYAVKEYLPQLPKDKWIVAYCACPHAESGKAAKALKENGYTKVKVFNEGFIAWRDRKYPITKGPKP